MSDEVKKLFEGCRSNLETPLTGQIYDPPCRTCANLVCPEDIFNPNTCRVFGKLPKEIYLSNGAQCRHYISKR